MPSLSYSASKYCYAYGNPFSWTQRKIEAAEMFAKELNNLTDDEKQSLKTLIGQLIKGDSLAEPAKHKFKNIMLKLSSESSEIMRSILVNVFSEAIRKSLYG
jgi:hypothetical protein